MHRLKATSIVLLLLASVLAMERRQDEEPPDSPGPRNFARHDIKIFTERVKGLYRYSEVINLGDGKRYVWISTDEPSAQIVLETKSSGARKWSIVMERERINTRSAPDDEWILPSDWVREWQAQFIRNNTPETLDGNPAALQRGREVPTATDDGRQVVHLYTPVGNNEASSGSGLFVTFDGVLGVLTNNHVVGSREEASKTTVVFGYIEPRLNQDYRGTVTVHLDPNVLYTGGDTSEYTKRHGDGSDWSFIGLRDQQFRPKFHGAVIEPYDLTKSLEALKHYKYKRVQRDEGVKIWHHSGSSPRQKADLRVFNPDLIPNKPLGATDQMFSMSQKVIGERVTRWEDVATVSLGPGGSGSPIWDEESRLVGILPSVVWTDKDDRRGANGIHIDFVLRSLDFARRAEKQALSNDSKVQLCDLNDTSKNGKVGTIIGHNAKFKDGGNGTILEERLYVKMNDSRVWIKLENIKPVEGGAYTRLTWATPAPINTGMGTDTTNGLPNLGFADNFLRQFQDMERAMTGLQDMERGMADRFANLRRSREGAEQNMREAEAKKRKTEERDAQNVRELKRKQEQRRQTIARARAAQLEKFRHQLAEQEKEERLDANGASSSAAASADDGEVEVDKRQQAPVSEPTQRYLQFLLDQESGQRDENAGSPSERASESLSVEREHAAANWNKRVDVVTEAQPEMDGRDEDVCHDEPPVQASQQAADAHSDQQLTVDNPSDAEDTEKNQTEETGNKSLADVDTREESRERQGGTPAPEDESRTHQLVDTSVADRPLAPEQESQREKFAEILEQNRLKGQQENKNAAKIGKWWRRVKQRAVAEKERRDRAMAEKTQRDMEAMAEKKRRDMNDIRQFIEVRNWQRQHDAELESLLYQQENDMITLKREDEENRRLAEELTEKEIYRANEESELQWHKDEEENRVMFQLNDERMTQEREREEMNRLTTAPANETEEELLARGIRQSQLHHEYEQRRRAWVEAHEARHDRFKEEHRRFEEKISEMRAERQSVRMERQRTAEEQIQQFEAGTMEKRRHRDAERKLREEEADRTLQELQRGYSERWECGTRPEEDKQIRT